MVTEDGQEAARPKALVPEFRIGNYTGGITRGWPDSDIQRAILCGLPRRFHGLTQEERRRALEDKPPLTGTRWDALLAAVVEHISWLHDLSAPEWVHEAERFLQETWILSSIPEVRDDAVAFSPPAFLRHGVLPDPADLDARGGGGIRLDHRAMNTDEPELLRSKQLLGLLEELANELGQRGARGQIYLIGGAAMSLGFRVERRTEDLDGRIDRGHDAVQEAAEAVAKRHGLAEDWLNEDAEADAEAERSQGPKRYTRQSI